MSDKIQYVCCDCGSIHIYAKVEALWSLADQKWVVDEDTVEDLECDACASAAVEVTRV